MFVRRTIVTVIMRVSDFAVDAAAGLEGRINGIGRMRMPVMVMAGRIGVTSLPAMLAAIDKLEDAGPCRLNIGHVADRNEGAQEKANNQTVAEHRSPIVLEIWPLPAPHDKRSYHCSAKLQSTVAWRIRHISPKQPLGLYLPCGGSLRSSLSRVGWSSRKMRFVPVMPPLPSPARRILVASVAIGLGLMLGACSSSRTAQYQNPSWAGAQPPVPAPNRQAAYEPAPGDPIKEPPIEPVRRPNAMPDDPTEPFSPNYGGPRTRPPVQVSDAATSAHDPEPDRQPATRRPEEASRAYFRRVTTTAAAD
jgi:hypothetical protein